MSSGAAIIGLKIDGEDVQRSDLGVFLELVRGLNEGPTVRGVDTVVPGLPGRLPGNRVADTNQLEVFGFVSDGGAGSSEAEARAAYRANATWLRQLMDQTAAPLSVVATLEDGSTASITARVLPDPIWKDEVAGLFTTVDYQLESVDADWTRTGGGS
jgi:hypothetical protein